MSGVPEPWRTGLCDCFDDYKSCCLTCFCPCATFGMVAENVDKGALPAPLYSVVYTVIAVLTGFSFIFSCFYRSKVRKEYGIEGDRCGDFMTHFFCEYCALCQEWRELESRGFNMSIGWAANMEARNQQGAAMGPVPVERGMSRHNY